MTLLPVNTGDPHVAAHNEEREAINSIQDELPLKLSLPTNPLVGELLRFDGTAWARSKTRIFEGNGQPEGVVAAPIGSRYVDVGAEEGAVEWLKASGVDANDNTGWILLAGDTGWRNVSNLINRRSTAVVYAAYIRRVNQTVDMYFDFQTPTNTSTPWTFLTVPLGFRPTFLRFGVLQDNNEAAAKTTSISAAGEANLNYPEAAKRDRWNASFTTTDPWPAVLPGTPV